LNIPKKRFRFSIPRSNALQVFCKLQRLIQFVLITHRCREEAKGLNDIRTRKRAFLLTPEQMLVKKVNGLVVFLQRLVGLFFARSNLKTGLELSSITQVLIKIPWQGGVQQCPRGRSGRQRDGST